MSESAPDPKLASTPGRHHIGFQYLSQEDLLKAGCLDFRMAIDAAEKSLLAHRRGDVMFPEKIVQIFDEATQKRINCLPATLRSEKICGMKWVSVFPPNVEQDLQNLTALFVLSEIEHGFPIAVMEGTLASNIRVAAIGALAAKHLRTAEPKVIGFIGAGEQAKMHLLAMMTIRPTLEECRVSAKTAAEEELFIEQMSPIAPSMRFVPAHTNGATAMSEADILVTATSAGPAAESRLDEARVLLQPHRRVGGRIRRRQTMRQDRLRRLGDGQAPHSDAQPHVQEWRAARRGRSRKLGRAGGGRQARTRTRRRADLL